MSYYDDPLTYIHANIASQTSILTNLNYLLNNLNLQIQNSLPDTPQEFYDQQAQLIISIQNQEQVIYNLQNNFPSSNIVDISNVLDISNNNISLPN